MTFIESRLLMTIIMWAVVMVSLAGLINYASTRTTQRAVECSQMLHGHKAGTLVPITEDASVEIGACLLQFNQPISGEKK